MCALHGTRQAGAVLLACLIVTACGSERGSAPGGDAPPAASQATNFVSYTVRPGDTVGAVAQRLQVPLGELIALNRLRPPYSLVPGQHLALPEQGGPAPRTHMVQAGDTVAGLATRYQVPIRNLIEFNALVPPYPLVAGRVLIIPPPRQHVVQSGDTIYNISQRYGVDQSSLIAFNNIPPPYTIYVGQRLQLPAAVESTVAVAVPAASQVEEQVAEGIASEQLPPAPAASAAEPSMSGGASQSTNLPSVPPPAPGKPAGSAAAGATASATTPTVPEVAPVPQPQPLSGGKFLWPVSGKIVSRFGTMQGGLHNDGINIAAPRGTPVRATENGVVAYSGNELRGFGNLLLIRHADGWISAYAHNETLLVKRGDQVQRGETIAHVGSTGNVSSPQLHFEIRRGAEAVDPLGVLGSQNAAITPGVVAGVRPDPG